MQKIQNANAYIDGANLYNGIKTQKWSLDYRRFRVWLREKHGVRNAFIVTSDGDYASLVKMLKERDALGAVISPAEEKKCSILLKKTNASITFLGDIRLRPLLEKK